MARKVHYCYHESMKMPRRHIAVLVAWVFWFLVLPFPFERFYIDAPQPVTQWEWLGGYHIVVEKTAMVNPFMDFWDAEILMSSYHYASHLYLISFLVVALALGCVTAYLLDHATRSRKSQ